MWDWMRINVVAAMVLVLAASPKLANWEDQKLEGLAAQTIAVDSRPLPTTQPGASDECGTANDVASTPPEWRASHFSG
jgi:hypothetical protein